MVTQRTDTNDPWLSGKVGFQQAYSRHVEWDNITVTTGGPGQVVSAQSYDPWGLVLDDMSLESGDPDSRYKFTGKERDGESGYDYFGARYYDARIGRWMSVDPRPALDLTYTPYHYAHDNPVDRIDVDGAIDLKASAFSREHLNGLDYGKGFDYAITRKIVNKMQVVCNEYSYRSYVEGGGHEGFPISLNDQLGWFEDRGWAHTDQDFEAEEGDLVYFGDVFSDGDYSGGGHVIQIEAVKVVKGVRYYRYQGARGGNRKSQINPSWGTMADIARWMKMEFRAIGSIPEGGVPIAGAFVGPLLSDYTRGYVEIGEIHVLSVIKDDEQEPRD